MYFYHKLQSHPRRVYITVEFWAIGDSQPIFIWCQSARVGCIFLDRKFYSVWSFRGLMYFHPQCLAGVSLIRQSFLFPSSSFIVLDCSTIKEGVLLGLVCRQLLVQSQLSWFWTWIITIREWLLVLGPFTECMCPAVGLTGCIYQMGIHGYFQADQ